MAGSGGKRGRQRRTTRAEERLLLVVAGPNGAGKSTFVEAFLKPTGILIVNPDEVAKGLSPDSPEDVAYEAARVADTWRRDLTARGISFCMETRRSRPASGTGERDSRLPGRRCRFGRSSSDELGARGVRRTFPAVGKLLLH